jgi:hypothetical protein
MLPERHAIGRLLDGGKEHEDVRRGPYRPTAFLPECSPRILSLPRAPGSPSGRYPRRMSESTSIIGRWRITEMDNWDQEAVDLVQPGFIEFDDDGLGSLGFIVVTGELDCRDADRDGRPGVEFWWQGSDEGDDVSGRGWVALNADGTLEGHIYFHLGDDSAFRAERFNGVVQ